MSGKAKEMERVFEDAAARAAASLGLEIVEIRVRNQGAHSIVRIDIDRAGPRGVTIDDCEAMSRSFDAVLEAAGIERDRHDLQVSSPGLDRPIRTEDDVRRNTGRRVVIETRTPAGGQRIVRGVLAGASGNGLRVAEDGGAEREVPFEEIVVARQELEIAPRRRGGDR